jgi:hypothetical protein
MKKITLKKLLALALILILGGAAIGYYQYNKGPVDVKNQTGIKVAADILYQTFITDSNAARKKYAENILEVSGVVSSISENQQKQGIVLLKTSQEGAAVNCTLEANVNTIKEGDVVTIKGICNGIGQGDADLGILGDVYLTRCYLTTSAK